MAEVKKKEFKKKVFKGNIFFRIIFVFVLMLNFILLFLLFKSSNDLLTQRKSLALEDNLSKAGFNKNYINEVQPIKDVFLNEKQTLDFITKINGMSSSFESLSLKFESSEPIVDLDQKSLPFVLEASGNSKTASLFIKDLLNSSCQFKVSSLLIKSKDTFINSAEFLLKAELLVTDEY